MQNHQILLEKNIPAKMRDDTVLYADIYRPDREGTFPVLLSRIPYGKDDPFYSHRYLDTNRLVGNGYIVIIQDVRGRFHSEGEFSMFTNEAEDGYDTIEWAASLPYASGKVGMFGLSYYGFTQLLAASQQPPHLHAIFPAQTLNDPRNGSMYQNGALSLGLQETMALGSIAADQIQRKYQDSGEYRSAMKQLAKHLNHLSEWYNYAPINNWPPLKNLDVDEEFFKLLSYELTDEFWTRISIIDKYEQMSVPAYHAAGWYDVLLNTTLDNYTEMTRKSDAKQKLIIGPWAHGDFGYTIGERSFGIHASEDWINLEEDFTNLHLRWFDYWLKGKNTEIMDEDPVKIFVMGINEWRNEQEWPLARTNYTPYYIHSDGDAHSQKENGILSLTKPKNEPVDRFIYDPKQPVPTHGGGTLHEGIQTTGPRDQRQIEERSDVLVYTSAALQTPIEVTGPVKVILWAATDAKDTDFTAKLIDVCPDGTAYNLTDGIVRAKYRNGDHPEPHLNQEIVKYEIDLWATSNVFLTNHRMRIEISSSNFPRFDTNPNTGETLINTTQTQTATQIIYHDNQHPSYILLPIIAET